MRFGRNALLRSVSKPMAYRSSPQWPRFFRTAIPVQSGRETPKYQQEIPSSPSPVERSTRLNGSLASKLSLEGKVTVITGGCRGIGLAIAEAMAGLGSDVALLDILDPQVDLAGLQSDAGGRIKHYKTDVTQKASMESAVSEIVKDFGRVNNCITAAGITLEKPFIDHEWEECRRVLDINVMGSYFCAQLVARQMIKQNSGGSIVMIASVAAHCAVPAQRVSMYGASKAAIKLLGKTLGVEMAPYNIRVNTLSPGYIATEMTAQFKDLQGVFNRVPPLGRIGQRDDLTMAVAYLLSDGALYTTGADIVVSGGLHNGRIDV